VPRREQLEELLRADPDDSFLLYALALECAAEGEIEDAVERLAGLLARDPDYVPAWFQRGQLLARLERVAESRGVLDEGIEAAGRTGDAHAVEEMTAFRETLGS